MEPSCVAGLQSKEDKYHQLTWVNCIAEAYRAMEYKSKCRGSIPGLWYHSFMLVIIFFSTFPLQFYLNFCIIFLLSALRIVVRLLITKFLYITLSHFRKHYIHIYINCKKNVSVIQTTLIKVKQNRNILSYLHA